MGTLPPAQRVALEAHLDTCTACAEVVAEVARAFGSEMPSIPARGEPPTHPPSDAAAWTGPPNAMMVGRYALGRQLGSGGMGVVYEAHDPELHRRVAVKLLHGGLRGDAAAYRAHLMREARAMAQLAHPNVVMVHDVGQIGDRVFVAMELVEGPTLREWLATRPEPDAIVDAFAQAGAGLLAAHAIGLVHRDFKPDNVLVAHDRTETARPRVRVTDFGLARPLDLPATDGPSPVAAALDVSLAPTRSGAVVGTPAYMSPEQLRGDPADARSDQFSFCVALYEAFHGRRPFAGTSFAELASNVLSGRQSPIAGSTPPNVRRVLARGLAVLPHRRYRSMAELLAELQRPRRSWTAPMIGVAAASGAAVAVGGVLLFALPDDAQPSTPTMPAASPEPPREDTAPSICDGIGATWSPARRTAIVEQVHKGVFGDAIAPATGDALDAWVDRWSERTRAACTTNDAVALACLGAARERFAALTGELGDADSIEAAHALEAATELPSPERCANADRARRTPVLPAKDELAARATLVRREIATARAQVDLAAKDAVDTATAAVASAEAIGYAPAIAEARLALGLAQRRAGRLDDATPTLEAAVVAATEGSHPDVATEAALALVEIVGVTHMRPADAEKWIRIVQAEIDAFDDRELAVELALHRVAVARAVAEWQDAREAAEAALELQPESIEARLALARALLDGDDAKGSLEHARAALASAEQRLPDRDYRFARLHAAIGHAQAALGDRPAALDAFAASSKRRIYPRAYDEDVDEMRADVGRAQVLAALGRTGEAEEAFAEAYNEWPEWLENADVIRAHAQWLAEAGRHEDALARVREAVAYLEAKVGAEDPRLVPALRSVGTVATHVGAFDVAEAALQRAAEILEQSIEYGPLWGLVHETRADLRLGQGDDRAALAELDEAHVPIVSAYGVYGAHTRTNVRRRADLAWELGDREYAARLYGAIAREMAEAFGPDHPDVLRVTERAAAHNVSR